MAKALEGKTIVIGGSRKIEEISLLIEKQGGKPLSRPLQGTVFLAEKEVEPSVMKFVKEGADWFIFTTGIGTETLLRIAGDIGEEEAFLRRLGQAKIASRGYKTLNVLKKTGLKPLAVDEDGSTQGLIRSLEDMDFKGKRVVIQLHGESAPKLIAFLENKGADVETILPYQHIRPEDETVKALCGELLNDQADAVCFTTQIQVRSLFDYARKNGLEDRILHAFKESALAVSVGKVTSEALRDEGVSRYIAPERERMGAMIVELAKYFDKASTS
ncbi:uroporphyrinogen-III synthase [Jeotgalibacillus campisalis]|uniref:Uroporphyrinogen-III synthase n=1 Tax=Jeotgalibacillus campisalis TaxID=220754 RepID=A0A0C2R0C6_9BACL|nr:uroporphyrinogen-III synthase [Jeotgalibacillus campisalis]KIL43780.1 uroporphyrinogen-III synthase [Jeotgalibacillus campisalis]